MRSLQHPTTTLADVSFSSPELHGFFKIASRVALVTEKNLNFLIGRLKMNAQQGTTFYPSTHNIFLPVEFQMLARVYQPVEICRLHQQFQRSNAISMCLKAKIISD